jgi:hypothetical protein
MRLDPAMLPSWDMSPPFAWEGKASWAMPVMTRGYRNPVRRVRMTKMTRAGFIWRMAAD